MPSAPLSYCTFSIVARCPHSGQLGVAVSSAVPCVGAFCAHVTRQTGAASTQAQTNPYLAIEALHRLGAGHTPTDALKEVLARDPKRERRQIILVDAGGRVAGYTGTEVDEWAGHGLGEDYAVAGNLLADEAVLSALAQTFEQSEGELAERLLRALEAGQAAGGDRRGKVSAALLVMHEEDYPYVSIRVDEHAEPVAELRRIFEIVKAKLLAPHTHRARLVGH